MKHSDVSAKMQGADAKIRMSRLKCKKLQKLQKLTAIFLKKIEMSRLELKKLQKLQKLQKLTEIFFFRPPLPPRISHRD